MKTETVQTRQLLWISESKHAHRTGYFIMKIVEQGLKIHGKVRNQGYFFKKLDLSVDDQGNYAFGNGQWTLVLWPTLNSISLANQIEFLDMFWWFDGRIFLIIVYQPFEAWVTCRQGFPRESWGESKNEEWSFLSLIRSEKFARQVTALFENMRILKFKSQQTIAFFALVNHLNGPRALSGNKT